MPPSLPREILDLIVDNLHDDLNTLKMCCLVSKAWVYQTRTHLFNRVHFQNYGGQNIWQWGNTFPDPLNSPAHYTRIISIDFSTRPSVGMAHVLLTFRCVTHLNIHIPYWFFLVPLHQFSPVVGSLRLSFHDFPASEIFDFIRSFPLLEDLSLAHRIELDRNWNPPSTTPILTGSLELKLVGISDMVHQLLDLPNGLHFKRIAVLWTMEEDVRPTMDLVSRCSKTLESLEITGDLTGMLLQRVIPHSPLTSAHRRGSARDTTVRPFQSNQTQGLGISVQSRRRRVDRCGALRCANHNPPNHFSGGIS